MTEKNLFRTTLITLGSTIVLPLIVAMTGVAAPNGASTNDLVKGYLSAAHGADAVQANNSSSSSSSNNGSSSETKSDTNSSSTQSNPSTDQTTRADTATTTTPAATDTRTTATAGVKAASTYVVKEGDTYGCIAERYYGSYEQWPKVYAANSAYPGYEEYHLNVGAVVQLPAVSTAEVLPQTSVCK